MYCCIIFQPLWIFVKKNVHIVIATQAEERFSIESDTRSVLSSDHGKNRVRCESTDEEAIRSDLEINIDNLFCDHLFILLIRSTQSNLCLLNRERERRYLESYWAGSQILHCLTVIDRFLQSLGTQFCSHYCFWTQLNSLSKIDKRAV